jgi:hypothetical protein
LDSLGSEGDVQERAELSGILPDTGARVSELLHHHGTDASQELVVDINTGAR